MADIELVIKIPEEAKQAFDCAESNDLKGCYYDHGGVIGNAIKNGISLPKGHGRLKDEDEIVRAIEDRVEFLRKNDAIFMRLRKDIDILGCIPKIRCEVPTIIEADKENDNEVDN